MATTSTAEAELVEVMEGAIAGEAVRVVLEEVLDRRIRMVSLTDSSSVGDCHRGDRLLANQAP